MMKVEASGCLLRYHNQSRAREWLCLNRGYRCRCGADTATDTQGKRGSVQAQGAPVRVRGVSRGSPDRYRTQTLSTERWSLCSF